MADHKQQTDDRWRTVNDVVMRHLQPWLCWQGLAALIAVHSNESFVSFDNDISDFHVIPISLLHDSMIPFQGAKDQNVPGCAVDRLDEID